jgi:hypothetical protein
MTTRPSRLRKPSRQVMVILIVLVVGYATFFAVAFEFAIPGPAVAYTRPPYSIQMVEVGASHPNTDLYYIDIAVNPTVGLATAVFGLRITNISGSVITPGIAPPSCAAPYGGTLSAFNPENCGTPDGNWYAVLVFENTTVSSVFDVSGRWSGASASVDQGSSEINIVSNANYTDKGYYLSATPVGPDYITGGAVL